MSDDYKEDRKIGLRMALEVGAEKTAETIKNSDMGFQAIYAAAEAEIGSDALIKKILEGPPIWSHIALSYMSCPPETLALLHERSRSAPAEKLRPPSGSVLMDQTNVALVGNLGGPLSSMNLFNAMAATVTWTVNWQDAGVEQPKTAYPDWNKWHWSGDITAGCGSQMALTTVAAAVPSAPLNSGDTVWIYVFVHGGTDLSGKGSIFQFTYDPGSIKTAYWNASGTTTINSLSLTDYK